MASSISPKKRVLPQLAAAAFYLACWQAAAWMINQPLWVPSPGAVFVRLAALAATSGFWLSLAASMGRVAAAFALGVVLAVALAVATCRFGWVRVLVTPLLSALRATPVASFIILALVWMGSARVPVFTGLIMTLPIVWANVVEGIEGCDPAYFEMALVFGLSRGKRLRYLYLPQVAPPFAAACVTAMGLTWKAVIAAEVLGTPKMAIGSAIYASKIYLETADLFAWTLVVIVLSVVFERLFARALQGLMAKMGWGERP
jgi:NitT/TauT family transport system permease protein